MDRRRPAISNPPLPLAMSDVCATANRMTGSVQPCRRRSVNPEGGYALPEIQEPHGEPPGGGDARADREALPRGDRAQLPAEGEAAREGEVRMRVLVANSPLAYREVISATLEELRPHLEVFTAEPEDLDWEFRRLSPQLVLCSRVSALVERQALAWVELYPDLAPESVVVVAGRMSVHPQLEFADLLAVVDEAEQLYENAYE